MENSARGHTTTTSEPTASSKPISANDKQPGGTHYRASYQHWDYVADVGLGYFEAQVTKYICRHRKKNGLLDVEKAEHFLEKMIELRMRNPDHFRPTARAFSQYQTRRFITAQEPALGEPESNVINLVSAWEGTPQLQQALQIVRSLKLEYYSEGAPTRGYNAQSLEPGEQS